MEKIICELVFVNNSMGVEKKINKNIRAKKIDSFSTYYYENLNRALNSSLNIIVDKMLINPLEKNDNFYHLLFVKYNGKLYKIKNILKYKNKSRWAILDCDMYE